MCRFPWQACSTGWPQAMGAWEQCRLAGAAAHTVGCLRGLPVRGLAGAGPGWRQASHPHPSRLLTPSLCPWPVHKARCTPENPQAQARPPAALNRCWGGGHIRVHRINADPFKFGTVVGSVCHAPAASCVRWHGRKALLLIARVCSSRFPISQIVPCEISKRASCLGWRWAVGALAPKAGTPPVLKCRGTCT